jgi:hypothetical protein
MFKKSSELCKIQDLKGNQLGYIRCRNGITTVVWLDVVRVVSMSFTGPASVVFGKIIVECDGRRVIAPKTIAPVLKETKKELGTYIDTLYRVEWAKIDLSFYPVYTDYMAMVHIIGEMTIGTKVPHQVKWNLEEKADKRHGTSWL